MKSALRDHRRRTLGFDRREMTFSFRERLCRARIAGEHSRLNFKFLFDDFEVFEFLVSGGVREAPWAGLGWSWAVLGLHGGLLGGLGAILVSLGSL